MPANTRSVAAERALIASRLSDAREQVVATWMQAITDDSQIPSADRLTFESLRDHFPQMLQELIEDLKQGGGGQVQPDQQTRETGRAHGTGRWKHGYRLDEVLRELVRIRELLIEQITAVRKAPVSEDAIVEAVACTRRFFDTIAATSAQEFVRAQDAEAILRARQLEHAYQQVQAATEQLRMTEESRLSLMRGVNHELRNALQPVAFAANALLSEPDPINRAEISSQLARVATRLQKLLERLTHLSGLLSGDARLHPLPVDLDAFVSRLDKEWRPVAAKAGVQFSCSRSASVAEVVSDHDSLQQIAEALLSNAFNHTTAGSVRLEILDPTGKDDDDWILRVTDTGSGIDPIHARHVFHEFHAHTDSQHTGLRLGLLMARHLARLLGGEITFQSRIGEGSTFEARLPRISPARD
jgi:signal transduction histidine kinase